MFDLSGKTALVTGASGGIGQDIARCLHGAGARVGLAGTRETALQNTQSEAGKLFSDGNARRPADGGARLAGDDDLFPGRRRHLDADPCSRDDHHRGAGHICFQPERQLDIRPDAQPECGEPERQLHL